MSSFPGSHKSVFNKAILTGILSSELPTGNANETKEKSQPGLVPSKTFTVVWIL